MDLYDLGEDGKRDLGWILAAEWQADWRMETCDMVLRQSLFGERLDAGRVRALAA